MRMIGPGSPRFLALVALTSLSILACRIGVPHGGSGRPDDSAVAGPPPPTYYHCERGERAVKAKPHHVLFVLDRAPICDGIDTNEDGSVDEWDLLEDGKIVDREAVDREGHLRRLGPTPAADAGAPPP